MAAFNKYMWSPGDLDTGEQADTDVRTAVRQALGDAAHAMSDQEIDAVIAAAQGAARTDDLSDADLETLSGLDAEPRVDPNEDDLSDTERDDLDALQVEYGIEEDEEEDGDREDSDGDDWREDGPGYNPNRAPDGKFAPGAHTARISKAQGRVSAHADKISAAKQAKRAAVADARAKLKAAKAADAKAKKSPTPENKKAARSSATEARRAARLVDKHEFTINRYTAKHAEAKQKLSDAKAEARAAKAGIAPPARQSSTRTSRAQQVVARDKNREIIAHGIVDLPGTGKNATTLEGRMLNERQFSPEAQRAIREHHNAVLASYGLHNKDVGLIHSNTVEVRTESGMAFGGGEAALGLHWPHDGRIALDIEHAQGMIEHSRLDAGGLKNLGRDYQDGDHDARKIMDSYRVSTHEAVHGHGPDLIRVGHHNMLEEISTEMVARKVTADVHDIPIDMLNGSYGRYINPTGAKIWNMTGRRDMRDVHEALAYASLEFKRKSGRSLSPSDELHTLGRAALEKLGIHDPEKHQELYEHMAKISEQGP